MKWSQKIGQSAKVYAKPMKRYENGEAPLQETGVEQLVSTTTQTPNAPLSLLTLRSIRAAFFAASIVSKTCAFSALNPTASAALHPNHNHPRQMPDSRHQDPHIKRKLVGTALLKELALEEHAGALAELHNGA